MMDNYDVLPNGIIKQRVINKIEYTYDYSNKYNQYGEKGRNLSYLRLGTLIGLLQHVPTSIADIGYGNGDFLRACENAISQRYGCDISEYPIPDSATRLHMEDLLKDKGNRTVVDVVCFFDSLEHLDDISIVAELNTTYVYISVPWCHSTDPVWFLNWYHRRENEHLWHFSEHALRAFFSECGYDCIYTGCVEDIIRKNPSVAPQPNILTGLFKKRA